MSRLAVVDTGPPPLGDLYGRPEDLDAYVQGALARGETVDQTLIDLVETWRLDNDMPPLSGFELRAASGLKPGGGRRQQFYGTHGRYAKEGAGSSSGSTATKERPAQPEQVDTTTELAAALHAPVRRRIEYMMSEQPPEHLKMLAEMPADDQPTAALRYQHLLYNGDEWALKNLTESKMASIGFEPLSEDRVTHVAIDQALDDLKNNQRYQAAVAKYGPVPILAVQTLGRADARYVTDAIFVADIVGTHGPAGTVEGGGGRDPAIRQIDPVPLPEVSLGEFRRLGDLWNVDMSVNGTLRHEYGHHVESLLSVADRTKFARAYESWGKGDIGPEGVDDVAKDVFSKQYVGQGLSLYSRTNMQEGFAEMFALVTHPDYDRSKLNETVLPMADLVEEFIGDVAAEQRAAAGLKLGGGGHLQFYGAHGRYALAGDAWSEAIARSPNYNEAALAHHDSPNAERLAAELADTIVASARKVEPRITRDIKSVAQSAGLELIGLDFRVKENKRRIAEKILEDSKTDDVSLAAAAKKVSDPVRYTFSSTTTAYVSSFHKVQEELAARGYTLRVKNFWQPGDAYNGVNIAMTAPNGVPVEVQFHTPMSHRIKEATHKQYEEFRTPSTPDHRRVQLWTEMVSLADNQPFPPGWQTIPGQKIQPPPPGYTPFTGRSTP